MAYCIQLPMANHLREAVSMGAPTGGKRNRVPREDRFAQLGRESRRCKGTAIAIALGVIISAVSPVNASYTRPTELLRVDVR